MENYLSLQMFTFQGNHVGLLGSASDPWIIEAKLVMVSGSDPGATLVTTSEQPTRNGWANFTDVAVTHAGRYALNFTVVYPVAAQGRFAAQSVQFEIEPRQLGVEIVEQPSTVSAGEQLTIEARLYDINTMEIVENLSWKVLLYTIGQYVKNLRRSCTHLIKYYLVIEYI